MKSKITVAVIDDVPEALDALAFYITCYPETLELVGQGSNGADAVRIAHELRPDVMLMDLQMPVMNGIEATRIILREVPATRIIAVSTFHSDEYVLPALQAGVHGYLLKDSLPDEVYNAIISAGRGRSTVDSRALGNLLASLPAPVAASCEVWDSLTSTEQQVTTALCRGLSNREIARCTGFAESTVKNALARVMEKLGVNSRLQIAIEAGKYRFPIDGV